jgi:universal stress protein E
MHAYEFLPVGIPPQALLNGETIEVLQTEARSSAQRGLSHSLRSSAVAPANRHVVRGLPCEAIPALAEQLGSQIVVMGAISRSGLKALFIGNTAERVIDTLKADILVVKPKRFQSPVRQTSRGVRLVASPFSPAII